MIYTQLSQKRIVKSIPVRVRSGKNINRLAGVIIYEHNSEPYYYVEKKYRQGQMWQKPEYIGNVAISIDIIHKDLIPRKVNKVVFMFIGYDTRSFYIVMELKEFMEGRIIEYDDKQYLASWRNKPRIYGNQVVLV